MEEIGFSETVVEDKDIVFGEVLHDYVLYYSFSNHKTETQNSRGQHRLHAGGRLNKKDGLTRYGDSHVKDKTS